MVNARLRDWVQGSPDRAYDFGIVVVALVVIYALLATGCSLRPSTRATATAMLSVDDCRKLDRSVMGWTGATIGLGVASGSTGVASALTGDIPRYVTGGVSVALAITSAVATYLSSAYAKQYVDGCTSNRGGAP